MIQRCRRWMRVVLPRGEMGLFVIFGILMIDGIYLSIVLRNWPPPPDFFLRARLSWLGACALGYGVYRAVAFHPLCDPDYRRWLELTPWKAGRPLPAGPLWLVPQDLVVILGFIGLSHDFTQLNFIIPITFLFGYLVSNLVLNWLAGEWALAYLMAFGLTGLPLLHAHPEYILPVEILCLGIAFWATRRSLRRFPWQLSIDVESQLYKSVKEAQQQLRLGWPFDLLAPTPPKTWIGYHDGICISLLLGWLEFTLITMFFNIMAAQRPFPPPAFLFVLPATYPSLIASICTLGSIYRNYLSPIDLWGRIRTMRWLIPRYDIMAATPIVAGLVSVLLHATMRIEIGAVGTAVAFLLLLVFSPKVEEWRLTGEHRISFNAKTTQEFIQL